MNKQLRVLMLVHNLRVSNGVSSYAMNYFRKLDHDSVQMDFAVYKQYDNPYESEITAAGGHIFVLPDVKNALAHIKACKKLLHDGHYDIVHDNSLLITVPMMWAAKSSVPVRILHSHNSKLGETEKKERRNALFLPVLLRQVNAYAACSDLAAKAMFGESAYEFIPNFVEAADYAFDAEIRARVRTEMGAEGKTIIATVGRVSPQKNPFFALDVFDLVAEKDPSAAYWWIGSGSLDREAAAYVKTLRHGDRVRLLGSRKDMKALYQAIDLFFLPSLFEGLPVTGVEAQASGLPCVVSDSVTKEMVFTDLVQYVSLNASKEHWAETVIDQLNRRTRHSRESELLHSRFSSECAGALLENYYRRLLKERSTE